MVGVVLDPPQPEHLPEHDHLPATGLELAHEVESLAQGDRGGVPGVVDDERAFDPFEDAHPSRAEDLSG